MSRRRVDIYTQEDRDRYWKDNAEFHSLLIQYFGLAFIYLILILLMQDYITGWFLSFFRSIMTSIILSAITIIILEIRKAKKRRRHR